MIMLQNKLSCLFFVLAWIFQFIQNIYKLQNELMSRQLKIGLNLKPLKQNTKAFKWMLIIKIKRWIQFNPSDK